jgi:Pyruvate/2-oxoacid:ferredoxin oxidoreductase delta subunit
MVGWYAAAPAGGACFSSSSSSSNRVGNPSASGRCPCIGDGLLQSNCSRSSIVTAAAMWQAQDRSAAHTWLCSCNTCQLECQQQPVHEQQLKHLQDACIVSRCRGCGSCLNSSAAASILCCVSLAVVDGQSSCPARPPLQIQEACTCGCCEGSLQDAEVVKALDLNRLCSLSFAS